MKVEVWYAVDEDGGQYLFTSKPKRYVEGDSNYWINLNCPMISWKNEPIKIELDIQAMVINQ